MNPEQIQALLESSISDGEFKVDGDGRHFNILAISDAFSGKRAVQRQQVIYAVLNDQIASGEIHAVNMKTYTIEEWQENGAK